MAVTLRPTTDEDLDFVLACERAPEAAPFVEVWTREQHHAALSAPDLSHLVLELEGRRVGFALLAGVSSSHRSIEFRRLVVSEPGQGIGRAAFRLVKQLAFEGMGAHRIWLDVKTQNTRSRALCVSEGFVEEGVLRDCLLGPDGFESLVVMSLLATDPGATG